MADPNTEVSRRVWGRLDDDGRAALTSELSPSDLQSLLLDVARARSSAVRPSGLAARWTTDRFVCPASVDPRRLSAVVARLWELLPYEIDGVELSPVTPLGTCAALGAADQNRVLSTARNSEVVSDLTNVLALEAARRRRADPDHAVHLAACHRVLRTQRFPDGWPSHFQLFALVSSDRDHGSGRTESQLLTKHLGYWQTVLQTMLPADSAEVRYSAFNSVLMQRFEDTVLPSVHAVSAGAGIDWVPDHDRTRARGYYCGAALLINARGVELGDGGFTDWTAQLLADRKERCLISCLSTQGLAGLVAR